MSSYDRYKTKRLTVTMGKDNINKMNHIAKSKGFRYTSDFYKEIVKKIISEYEAEHGEITLPDE